MFLYGDADFSEDVKKYLSDSNILIFKSAQNFHGNINSENNIIDLAVLCDCKNNNIIPDIKNICTVKTLLLNIESAVSIKNIEFDNTQIITCGLKEKDTVIFSSIDMDENSVILDLQRSIININGETIEPFEEKITVDENIKFENGENEDLIFALTTLLFCGRL